MRCHAAQVARLHLVAILTLADHCRDDGGVPHRERVICVTLHYRDPGRRPPMGSLPGMSQIMISYPTISTGKLARGV